MKNYYQISGYIVRTRTCLRVTSGKCPEIETSGRKIIMGKRNHLQKFPTLKKKTW